MRNYYEAIMNKLVIVPIILLFTFFCVFDAKSQSVNGINSFEIALDTILNIIDNMSTPDPQHLESEFRKFVESPDFYSNFKNDICRYDNEFSMHNIGITDTVIKVIDCLSPVGQQIQINIIWQDGLPRKGTFIDCNNNSNSVNYIDTSIIVCQKDQTLTMPLVTDSSFA